MRRFFLPCVLVVLPAVLFGCGGGGGGNSLLVAPGTGNAPTVVAVDKAATGQVVMAPVHGATIRFLEASGKPILFDNMSTLKTDADGFFKIRVQGATRILASGGVYADPSSGAVTPAPLLTAPGDAANVTALTTLVAHADDPAAIKAKIEAMGIRYDESLSKVTTANQNAVALAEGVGAAIKEIQAAAGITRLDTAMQDLATKMRVQLATVSDMKAVDVATVSQNAVNASTVVGDLADADVIKAYINSRIAAQANAIKAINPGAAGTPLATVTADQASAAMSASAAIQAAMRGDSRAVVAATASAQQVAVVYVKTYIASGTGGSAAETAAQAATQAAAQAAADAAVKAAAEAAASAAAQAAQQAAQQAAMEAAQQAALEAARQREAKQAEYTHQNVDDIILHLKQESAAVDDELLRSLSARAGVALTYVRPMSGNSHVLGLPARMTLKETEAICQTLTGDPRVAYAVPNIRVFPTTVVRM